MSRLIRLVRESGFTRRDWLAVQKAPMTAVCVSIVADTVNGKKLAGDIPFYFAATAKR